MRKSHYIITSLLIGLIGTGMHFLHHIEVSDHTWRVLCHFLPTGETCWEHMKLILYPMLILAVILWIKHKSVKAIGGAVLAMTITIPLSIALYYFSKLFTPEGEFIYDVLLYWVEIFFAVWLTYRWSTNERIGRLWPLWIGLTVAWIMTFFVLSFYPPENVSLFEVPESWAKEHPESRERVKGHRHHHNNHREHHHHEHQH